MTEKNKDSIDKYVISVVGTQSVDGESDTIELTTTAAFTERNGKKLIRYKEYADDSSGEYITTLLSIENDKKLSIIKNLDKHSELILEEGQRHQCAYFTPLGNMMIGVYTESISVDIDENGGSVEVEYTLDFNSGFESSNKIEIELRKKENTNV